MKGLTEMRLPRSAVSLLAGLMVCALVVVLPSNSATAATDPTIKYGSPVTFKGQQGWNFNGFAVGVNCNGQAYWVAQKMDATGLIRFGVKWVATNCSIMRPGNPPNMGDKQSSYVDGINDIGNCRVASQSEVTRKDTSAVDSLFTASWEETQKTVWVGWEDDPDVPGTGPIPGLGGLCVPSGIGHPSGWHADLEGGLGDRPEFGDVITTDPNGTCDMGTPQSFTSYLATVAGSTTKLMIDGVASPGLVGTWDMQPIFKSGAGVTQPAPSQQLLTPNPQTGQTTFTNPSAIYQNTDSAKSMVGIQMVQRITGTRQLVSGSTPGVKSNSYTYPYGWNEPEKCLFWIGPKVWDDGVDGSGFDEPYAPFIPSEPPGSLDEPVPGDDPLDEPDDPAAPDAACNFDILDPGSWISGSACALVGLLGQIVNLLLGILNFLVTLASMLTTLFTTLFVPDPTTWGLDELVTQFNERPPGSLISGAASGIDGMSSGMSAGGCGTLIDVSPSTGSGGVITCSAVKNVPGYSAGYNLFTLAIYALTGLAIFHMFVGAFKRD